MEVSPRDQYRRARTRRKTIIFGSTMIALTVAFALGYLGLQGSFAFPIEGGFNKKISYAEIGDIPCPTEGARPVTQNDVRLQVFNTTSEPGLASKVGDFLHAQGYYIALTDNANLFRGGIQIETGPRGVDAAYTVARFLGNDARIRLVAVEDKTLNILIGERFVGLPSAEETEQISSDHSPLVPKSDCKPVSEPVGGWDVPSYMLGWQQSAQEQREAEEAAKKPAG